MYIALRVTPVRKSSYPSTRDPIWIVFCICCLSGTSAKKHGGTELCSILNRAIRDDDPHAIIHAAVFAHTINLKLKEDRDTDLWLKKIFNRVFENGHVLFLPRHPNFTFGTFS